jgi:hypothetical protein
MESLEVEALLEQGLDPALCLAVGLGVVRPGAAMPKAGDPADPAPGDAASLTAP